MRFRRISWTLIALIFLSSNVGGLIPNAKADSAPTLTVSPSLISSTPGLVSTPGFNFLHISTQGFPAGAHLNAWIDMYGTGQFHTTDPWSSNYQYVCCYPNFDLSLPKVFPTVGTYYVYVGTGFDPKSSSPAASATLTVDLAVECSPPSLAFGLWATCTATVADTTTASVSLYADCTHCGGQSLFQDPEGIQKGTTPVSFTPDPLTGSIHGGPIPCTLVNHKCTIFYSFNYTRPLVCIPTGNPPLGIPPEFGCRHPVNTNVTAVISSSSLTARTNIEFFPGVTWHGGPIMHNPKSYAIFWMPPGYNYDNVTVEQNAGFDSSQASNDNYKGLILNYLRDAGASSYYKILEQYSDRQGRPGPSVLAGTFNDTSPFPVTDMITYDPQSGDCTQFCNPCTAATLAQVTAKDCRFYTRGTPDNPLNILDIENEIRNAMQFFGTTTPSINNGFYLFLPYDVYSCEATAKYDFGIIGALAGNTLCYSGEGTGSGSDCSSQCWNNAYHSFIPAPCVQSNGSVFDCRQCVSGTIQGVDCLQADTLALPPGCSGSCGYNPPEVFNGTGLEQPFLLLNDQGTPLGPGHDLGPMYDVSGFAATFLPGSPNFMPKSPNDDFFADTAIAPLAHEQFEMITNPLILGVDCCLCGHGILDCVPASAESSIAWDTTGTFANGAGKFEIGDLCKPDPNVFGPDSSGAFVSVGPDGSNLLLNGHKYIVYPMWDELDGGCSLRGVAPGVLTVNGVVDRQTDANGWYNHPVHVNWVGTDSIVVPAGAPGRDPPRGCGPSPCSYSGLQSCEPASTYSGPSSDSQIALTGLCTDLWGNGGTGTVAIHYDSTPPTSTATAAPPPNVNGWNNADVTVTLTATDAESGVGAINYTLSGAQTRSGAFYPAECRFPPFGVPGCRFAPAGTVKISSEGTTTLSYYGTDFAGNREGFWGYVCTPSPVAPYTPNCSLVPLGLPTLVVKIDKTPPGVTGRPDRQPDRNGWYNHPLTVTWVGTDNIDSIVSCDPSTGYSGPDTPYATVWGHCTDQAGNTGTGNFNVTYDSTPPAITSPQQGQSFILNQILSPSATCSDALSGIDMCTLPSGTLDTSTIGPHSYIVTAMDKAGNTVTLLINYNVDYSFSGTILPRSSIDQGRSLPVRFQLTDAQNNFVATATAQIWVDSLTNPGQSPGKSNTSNYFLYDPTANQYVYILATKNLSIGVHTVYITLSDGTVHTTVVNVSA